MNILKTTSEPQTYKCIPRYYGDSVIFKITDEIDNSVSSYIITPTFEFGWMFLTESFTLIEGRFYKTEVILLGDTIYRGRIFCTDQEDKQNYSMTSGSYTSSNPKNNDIILI